MGSKKTTRLQDNDEQFWELAGQFIDLANLGLEHAEAGKLGAAMLYAATRFNAFVVASASLDRQEFIADMDDTMTYLTKQFRQMLGDNLRDFRDNYKVYVRAEQDANPGSEQEAS